MAFISAQSDPAAFAMAAQLEPVLQCPHREGVTRCAGKLTLQADKLVCEKCSSAYRLAGRGVPVLRTEEPGAATDFYDGNYAHRRAIQEVEEKQVYSGFREMLSRTVREQNIKGPSLEVGCGTGLFADLLPNFFGLDYAVNAVTSPLMEQYPVVCGSAESLPFCDESFEAVFSMNTLEHVPQVDLAFEEIDRVLRKGGYVILKPAWHCTRYNTELLPIKDYHELNLRQKITKAMLPVLTSRPYKLLSYLPPRIWRRMTAAKPSRLKFSPLIPSYSPRWVSDADACSSIDCHEGILFFDSRGYQNLSHPKLSKRLLAGHDMIVLRKPGA